MAATVTFTRAALVLVIAVSGVVTGCLRSGAKRCGDVTCPIGRACVSGRCVDSSIVTACARQANGASCSLPQFGVGTCQTGMCLVGSCGDGVINAIDACDGDDLGGKTCLDFGSTYADGLKCAADCSFDTSGCKGFCGDGIRQTNEECDGNQLGGKTCITEGFYSGKLVCTSDCKINFGSCSGRCGDGIRNSFTEQCDATDFGGSTCELRGFHGDVQPLLCTDTCGLDPSSCNCGGVMCTRDKQKCVLMDNIYSCGPFP
jgi:hypothetical protein